MSWIVTLAVVGTGVISAAQQKKSAKAQEIELEKQAEEERLSAEGRELERRQRLNKALAANVVSMAAGGITGEGTPQSIALESAKQVSLSEGINQLSDRLKQAQLKRQAKNVSATGTTQAASTLLSTATSAYRVSE